MRRGGVDRYAFVQWSAVFGIGLLMGGWIACTRGDPQRGAALFQTRCAHCHTIGRGRKRAPDLRGVTRRWSRKMLRAWLNDPDRIYRQMGQRPLHEDFPPMPRTVLTPQEIEDLIVFLEASDAQHQ